MGNYDFKIDLLEGEAGERLTKEILIGEHGTVEVKRDWRVSETGNVAIEFKCRGKRSGIEISTATWWAIVLDGAKYGHEVVVLIKRKRLRSIAAEYYHKGHWTRGGDDYQSRMVLVPVRELVGWVPVLVKPELI